MKHIYTIFFILFCESLFSQKSFQIIKTGVFGYRKYELFVLDDFEFKRKGKLFYEKHKILNMRDSLILLDNDSIIHLSELKRIKLKNDAHIYHTLLEGSVYGFLGIPLLNIGNNLILDGVLRFDTRAILITSGFLAGAVFFTQVAYKRIKVNNSTTLKIIHLEYNH